MGLIIGVIPYIMKQAEVKKNFTARHVIILLVIGAALAVTAFIPTEEDLAPITSLTVPFFFMLFFSGWLASMAMLLPGISGSFILLLLGVYSTAIDALSTLNIPIIFAIGAGVIVGFIVSSKAIQYLLQHFTYVTYAAIIGLIIGSLFVVFPGFSSDSATLITSLVTFGLGLSFTLLFSSPKKTAITEEV
ncbi:Integral membrane protein [Planococcus halocryophilus Or1]|nr:Integral membrane protein [Planococcus halocryophilus Or1]